jgi:ABC-type multidrug transport system fused ATPase/permease subunit
VAYWNAWSATNALRDAVGEHIMARPLEFFRTHGIGELSERIDADPGQLQGLLGTSSGNVARIGMLLIGISYSTWLINPWICVALLGYVAVGGALVIWSQRDNADDWEQERIADAALYDGVEENFASVTDIKAVGAAGFLAQRLVPRMMALLQTNRHARMRNERATVVSGLVTIAGWVLALAIGSWRVLTAQGTIGEAVAVLGYVALLGNPIEHLRGEVQALQQAIGALRRIDDLLAIPLEPAHTAVAEPTQLSIHLNNVWYRYPSSADWVIRGITLTIPAGTHVAVLGRTGSGKSTLARLISGLESSTTGQILYNDTPITSIPPAQLRRWVGVISQEVEMFNASLRDNMTCFADHYSDDDIIRTVADLQLSDWLAGFRDGLDTPLGDGERSLSPGEEQLIAFVRLQLRNPLLIILDEASAHVDPINEQRINRALGVLGHGRSTMTIAHRLSTIAQAERILVIRDGEVAEYDTPAALVAQGNSAYGQLIAQQTAEA